MNRAAIIKNEAAIPIKQPLHVVGLNSEQRDSLVVSMRKIDNHWKVVSHYGDDIWWLSGSTTNRPKSETKLDFLTIPIDFRESVKAIMYRLMRRGRNGQKRPRTSSMFKTMAGVQLFTVYLHSLGISSLTQVSSLACLNYARTRKKKNGDALSSSTLEKRLIAVETLYELSQYTDTPIPTHPWPNSTAKILALYKKEQVKSSNTPLIPDDVFTSLFQHAWTVIQSAPRLLDLRDEMESISNKYANSSRTTSKAKRNERLLELGFEGGLPKLKKEILEIRTAAYIVIASVSGCRNHEIAFLRRGAYYSTEDDEGEVYWWMTSISTKTDEGVTEWMIPPSAVTALQVMERWCAPYQAKLRREIQELRARNPLDVRIAEAKEHLNALFVGTDNAKRNLVRTVSITRCNQQLYAFSLRCGLTWNLASHQFRRKFANYAAKSQFGDLRYLKAHFKHWSMNMTLGYALNESQEMALYLEILDELDELKEMAVANWLDPETPLAGGYGEKLINWRARGENIVLFKSHGHMVKSIAASTAIRSNGHAWCTADDNLCVGNSLDRTRCGDGCNNAVVTPQHAFIYQGLYEHLLTLCNADDLGKGGKERVLRDLKRCASVLKTLGFSPQGADA